MSFRNPFPFAPDQLMGLILERDQRRFLFWLDTRDVAAWKPLDGDSESSLVPDSSQIEVLQEIVNELVRQGVRRAIDLRSHLALRGYRNIGSRQYEFASGRLYQAAVTLEMDCLRAGEDRARLLAAQGGQAPRLNTPEWPEWEETIWRLHGCAQGTRVLGVAALDALANEILYVRFNAEYRKFEGPGKRAGLLKKIQTTLRLAGTESDPDWLDELRAENRTRRLVVHHEPGYRDDFGPIDSLELPTASTPSSVAEFMHIVDRAVAGLFSAFEAPVPTTHLRRQS